MRRTALAALATITLCGLARAGLDVSPDVSVFAAQVQALYAAIPPSDYLGTYTLAGGLPDAAANAGKRIRVPDLGGGEGYLRATGGCWKRVSTTTAAVQTVPVTATATVDGLATSPIIGLTGSAFAARATVTITNACSVPQITVVVPAGVFTVTGALGLAVNNGNAVTVAGIGTAGTWNDYAVSADGLTLTKIRGGSL